jgi:hypothetical protein
MLFQHLLDSLGKRLVPVMRQRVEIHQPQGRKGLEIRRGRNIVQRLYVFDAGGEYRGAGGFADVALPGSDVFGDQQVRTCALQLLQQKEGVAAGHIDVIAAFELADDLVPTCAGNVQLIDNQAHLDECVLGREQV